MTAVGLIGFVLAVLSAVLSSAATLVQARAARDRGHRTVGALWYAAGLALDVLGWAMSAVALRYLPVFAVQAIVATQVALTEFGAHLLGRTRLSRVSLAAALASIAGLATIAVSGHTGGTPAGHAATDVVTAAVTFAVLLAIPIALRMRGAVGCAVVAGLAFGAVAALVRALHQRVAHPGDLLHEALAYEAVALGLVGAVLFATALRRAAPAAVAAITVGTEVLMAGALGMLLLGDGVRPGWWLPCALGAATAIVGLTAIARTSEVGT